MYARPRNLCHAEHVADLAAHLVPKVRCCQFLEINARTPLRAVGQPKGDLSMWKSNGSCLRETSDPTIPDTSRATTSHHLGSKHTWALVLAGGEGSRLRSLTTRPCGTSVPKQFCSLRGGHTLLEDALKRGAGITAPERICTIVAQQHREWWAEALRQAPISNVIIQPRNRGTGVGLLYSLLHILPRDPNANLVLLPADHYVRDEALLRDAVHAALRRLAADPTAPVLLGVQPEEVDTELGYILPGHIDPLGGQYVARFIEKPNAVLAREVIEQGGMWNTFIIAASAQSLLDLFMPRFAPLVMEMQLIMNRAGCVGLPAASSWAALVDFYERLPQVDFSRDILEGREACLRLLNVPSCGWSDLGTPKRVAETLQRIPLDVLSLDVDAASVVINLAVQHAHALRDPQVLGNPYLA
jgi:mannose-1-phosphate guanylyltransferase